jgi:hypothetical protein
MDKDKAAILQGTVSVFAATDIAEGLDPRWPPHWKSYRRVSVNVTSDMATPALTVTARPRVS